MVENEELYDNFKRKANVKHNKLKTGISKGERRLLTVAIGKKKAETDEDQKTLKEIEDIKKRVVGYIYRTINFTAICMRQSKLIFLRLFF